MICKNKVPWRKIQTIDRERQRQRERKREKGEFDLRDRSIFSQTVFAFHMIQNVCVSVSITGTSDLFIFQNTCYDPERVETPF